MLEREHVEAEEQEAHASEQQPVGAGRGLEEPGARAALAALGRLEARGVGRLPEAWDSVCCAQFVVLREAVLRWPSKVYEDLYDWILERQSRAKKEKKLADSTMALEHSWRLLFENVTARRTSPCDDLAPPYRSPRVPVPPKPGLRQLRRAYRFRANGVGEPCAACSQKPGAANASGTRGTPA
mmetsp:Transcript_68956/g.214061  ORF Transcript_68956/g.214061 Transcript_68956/m.214061 type:complete len:183 (+) Transcript_68956:927-1475(+)